MAKLDRLGWAATSTFLIGHHYIGVRSSTDEADDLLRRILAPYLVTDVEAPPNYSLRLGGGRKVGRELHQVYRSSALVVRRRTVEQAVLGLLHEVCRHQPEDPDGLLRARVAVLLLPGEAILLPHPAREYLVTTSSSLPPEAALLDAPFARIDPETAELVTGSPPLDLDPLATADLCSSLPRKELGRDPVRRPITKWSFFGSDASQVSPARSVALAASTLLNMEQIGMQRSLDALGLLFGAVTPSFLRSIEAAASAAQSALR